MAGVNGWDCMGGTVWVGLYGWDRMGGIVWVGCMAGMYAVWVGWWDCMSGIVWVPIATFLPLCFRRVEPPTTTLDGGFE